MDTTDGANNGRGHGNEQSLTEEEKARKIINKARTEDDEYSKAKADAGGANYYR